MILQTRYIFDNLHTAESNPKAGDTVGNLHLVKSICFFQTRDAVV